ncbi:hypothetical protein [uncultured Bilophila sp.]|uniref:hypothetical protein n=1 Tax=uncultured Bilophila sp. TaxID=529385 RepID=UPI0025F6A874|nr:hypothetical protein [uncultured Bilophila sp.]
MAGEPPPGGGLLRLRDGTFGGIGGPCLGGPMQHGQRHSQHKQAERETRFVL